VRKVKQEERTSVHLGIGGVESVNEEFAFAIVNLQRVEV
jgi:hypothetical protein